MDQIRDEVKSALNKAAALCSAGEKSVSDIRTKLEKWDLSTDEMAWIIQTLINERFIDHQRFASFFVKDKFRFNKWGKRKIAFELSRKGIEQDIIQEALQTIDDADYAIVIKEILTVKLRQIKNKDPWQTKSALLRFGTSKGFETDAILQTINKFTNDDSDL